MRNDIAAPSFEANTERSDFAARQSSVPYMVCENINNVWISQECMGKQEAGEQRSPLSKNLSPTGDTIIPHSSLLILQTPLSS